MGQGQSLQREGDASPHVLYLLRCGSHHGLRTACTTKPGPATTLDCKYAIIKLLQLYLCGAFETSTSQAVDLSCCTLEELLDELDRSGPAFFGTMARDRRIMLQARQLAVESLDTLIEGRIDMKPPSQLLVLEGELRAHHLGEKPFGEEFLDFASRLAATYRTQSSDWHVLQ